MGRGGWQNRPMSGVYFKVYRGVCAVLSAYLAFWALTIAFERGGNWLPAFAMVAAMFALMFWAGMRTRKY